MPKTNNPATTATLKDFIVRTISHFTAFFNYCFAGRGLQLVLSAAPFSGETYSASSHSQARTRPILKNIGIAQTCRSVARGPDLRNMSPWSRYASPAEKHRPYLRRTNPQSL